MITSHPYTSGDPPTGLQLDRFLVEHLCGWKIVPLELLERELVQLVPAVAYCTDPNCSNHFIILRERGVPLMPFVPQRFVIDAWLIAEAIRRPAVEPEVTRRFEQAMRNGLRNPLAELMGLHVRYDTYPSGQRRPIYTGDAVPPVRSHRELWHLDQDEAARLICRSAWLALHQRTE